MKAIINVCSYEESSARALADIKAGKFRGAYFSYATPELLFARFTTPRWHIIRVMTGAGPMSIRELARRLKRDVKGVHRDVQALREGGLIENDESGAIVFPYDTVNVNFTLKAADLTPAAIEPALPEYREEAPPALRRKAAPRKSAARPAGR